MTKHLIHSSLAFVQHCISVSPLPNGFVNFVFLYSITFCLTASFISSYLISSLTPFNPPSPIILLELSFIIVRHVHTLKPSTFCIALPSLIRGQKIILGSKWIQGCIRQRHTINKAMTGHNVWQVLATLGSSKMNCALWWQQSKYSLTNSMVPGSIAQCRLEYFFEMK